MDRPTFFIGSLVRLTLMRAFDVAGTRREVLEGIVNSYQRGGVELMLVDGERRIFVASAAIAIAEELESPRTRG